MNLLRSGVFILIFGLTSSYGQISVTSTDILNLIGETHTVVGEGSGSPVTVDVGSAGANQTWDLRNIVLVDTIELNLEFVSPGDTPFASEFPSANMAYSIPFNEFGYTGVGYNYINVQSDGVEDLGFAAAISDPDTSIFDQSGGELVPLPVEYGDNWTSSTVDTFEFIPGYGTITISNLNSTVDGYGTIRLPAGDFECLRLRDEDEEIVQTLIAGNVALVDTTTSINYSWIGKESFLLAEIGSMGGEENPNFTQAEYVQYTSSTDGPSAIGENALQLLPTDMVLHANYPNPFNPSTTIRFEIPQAGNVQLVIYDLNGRLISTLVDGSLAAGSHSFTWNGRDAAGTAVASGVYIYRLQSMDQVQSRKLTLLR